MSESPVDVLLRADASAAISAIEGVERQLTIHGFWRAFLVALHNNYTPIRWVIGHRRARRLGLDRYGPDVLLLGLPVTIDETVVEGFGLVTRPPSA